MLMEFPKFYFQIIITCTLVLFMVIRRVRIRSKPKNSTQKSIPGPWKLPLIGNLHQLVGSLPHHCLRDLARKHGPLMQLQLGEVPTVVVSSPDIAKEIMTTHDIIFAYRPALAVPKITTYDCQDIAFAPYGSLWRQLRKVCMTELLSAARVRSFQAIREEEVSNLVKTIARNGGLPVNLSEKVFSTIYGLITRAAFGKNCKEQEEFIQLISEHSKLLSAFQLADCYPSIKALPLVSGLKRKAEKLHRQNDELIEKIMTEHKASSARKRGAGGEMEEDLVDVLLRLQEEGEFQLTDSNIKAVIMETFSAGSDTSSTTIEWTMSEMIKNPRVMREAQSEVRKVFEEKGNVDETGINELKYLGAVIKETLRLRPVVPLLLPRECSKACEINGYEIPAKARVLINALAIGRDSSYWPQAEDFIPERFLDSSIDYMGTNFEFIPFGGGRRICPGISFAVPLVQLTLAQLLFHFDWKLPNGMKHEDLDMTESFGLSVKRKNALVLIPTPYHASSSIE